jgi:hypothetical protein
LALPALIAGPAVTLTAHHAGAEVHRPAACSAPNRAVMQRTPTVTKLPEGAQLNVWDNHGSGTSRVRVTQVLVPHTSPLHLSLLTAGALTKAAPPGTIAQQHKNVVAMSNADIFDPVRGSLPTGDEVLNGKVAKAQSVLQNAVLIAKNGQSSPAGHIRLTGTVKAGGHSQHITGLNWQSLSGSGVNLYTAPWGHGRRPYGAVDVVVKSGKVVAVRRGSTRGQPPGNGEQILTANGAAATFLETLRPNEKVSVRYGFSSPGAPFKVWQAVNHGAPYLMNGKDWPVPCSSRNEILRPRTAVGWTKQGDLMLVVVSGENSAAEGGSTLPNMEYYLRALHAYNADAMDGGFSSTLVVRKKAGGAVSRVDRPGAAQRHVPNYLAFD